MFKIFRIILWIQLDLQESKYSNIFRKKIQIFFWPLMTKAIVKMAKSANLLKKFFT